MITHLKKILPAIALCSISAVALGHGNVTPQAIDTSELKQLGDEWLEKNPYVGNKAAIEIGSSAYSQNCARCHGLGAVSGGIAPDLRMLPDDEEGDEWFIMRARNGSIRNGVTYMPKFEGLLTQEAIWSIRAWVLTLEK